MYINGVVLVVLFVFFSACSWFQRNTSNNEIEALTKDVFKKNEGVEIEVKPIPNPKLK